MTIVCDTDNSGLGQIYHHTEIGFDIAAIKRIFTDDCPGSIMKNVIQQGLPQIKYPRASIVQILQNLLSNSIKYMDKPNPLITISYFEKESYYTICVTDNGMGIPQERLKEIFNLFEVAHSGRYDIESHGIGLTIVKQLVEENVGSIWVDSTLGEETKFQFTVPKN